MSDRNSAFADVLLGTGLRSAEAHSLTILEVPEERVARAQIAVLLSAGIAKGRVNERLFYLDHPTLSALHTYIGLSREAAVRRAHAKKTYDKVPGKLIVTTVASGANPVLTYVDVLGAQFKRRLSKFSPRDRENLFDGRGANLVPLALWLSQDGTPLSLRAWQGVFKAANERCRDLAPTAQQAIYCHPHMLRHTFAMVKLLQFRMVIDRKYGLRAADRRDNEMKYSPAYDAVRDLLGHASSVTTRKVYLTPLRDLEVQLMLREVDELGGPDPFQEPDDLAAHLMTGK
jgi:integrase